MGAATNDLVSFLRGLRADKAFTDEAVSDEALRDILEVGRWAGSGGNRQPTEVIVVRDPAVRARFGEWGARPAETAPVVLLLVTSAEDHAFDEGRLAERLLLAAAAHGLGSTVATLKNEGLEAAGRLLGIPPDRRATTIVALGHPDLAARRAKPKNPQPRKPVAAFAHQERY